MYNTITKIKGVCETFFWDDEIYIGFGLVKGEYRYKGGFGYHPEYKILTETEFDVFPFET